MRFPGMKSASRSKDPVRRLCNATRRSEIQDEVQSVLESTPKRPYHLVVNKLRRPKIAATLGKDYGVLSVIRIGVDIQVAVDVVVSDELVRPILNLLRDSCAFLVKNCLDIML